MPDKAQPGSRRTHPTEIRFLAGVDVGSTTVKAVVVAAGGGEILWRDYRRHDTRQAEMLREFLQRMESEIGIAPGNCRIFITGSGGSALAAPIGACFVQEVNAVALAVEKMHPEAQSVIELGGQDAKIILFKTESGTGRRRKSASMNDKCAGGTGAVIDKIQAKLKITADELPHLAYRGVRIHPVAGKCGVFAETDINGLQKQGVPPAELMASLFDAIVLQNLTVLTRGHTLLPHVLLLGGPNAFLRGMREAWQHNIPLLWKERGIELPPGQAAEDLIQVLQMRCILRRWARLSSAWEKRRRRVSTWAARRWNAFLMPSASSGRSPTESLDSALPSRNCEPSKTATRALNSFPQRFSAANRSRLLSASMAVPRPPRRCFCQPAARCWPRPIGSPRATRSRMPSRCWAICAARWKRTPAQA
jgi:hypothetical protein